MSRTLSVLPLLFLFAVACAVNPATGRRELTLMTEGQEIALGREADEDVTASLGLVDDPDLQAYVADLGARLAATSERPDLPWSFKVVDDPVVNAFALPGGFIYVTRGILAHFESEAELAGVLGHEIGHVTARHSVSQMSRQQLQQIGLGVGMILSEDVRRYGGLVAAGLGILNLSYSRGDETQSDELGVRYMGRAGYDPRALVGVFEMLASVSGGEGGRVPEWTLTHPYPENRETHIQEVIAASGLPEGGRVGRDAYVDRLDGLIYGEDPRQGYFRGSQFVHPDLAFQLRFPEGWTTVNQRSSVAAISPGEDAVIVLELVSETSAPTTALRSFLQQEGIRAGAVEEGVSGGVERASADFTATTDEGEIRGAAHFLREGGRLYRILGYTGESTWRSHASALRGVGQDFAVLTDPALLGVQPWRLEIVTLGQAMTLTEFHAQVPSPVSVEELARLNRRTPDARLARGTRLKRVVGRPLP
jgi:predicted Zn-dependent protease